VVINLKICQCKKIISSFDQTSTFFKMVRFLLTLSTFCCFVVRFHAFLLPPNKIFPMLIFSPYHQ
jgi:hypothetical protein